MPLQNRATPFGNLIQTPERGDLMGNRGCLINNTRTIVHYYKTKNWIICKLSFAGQTLPLMEPGTNTQIFFLDEATALAAGHRPCRRCMRDRFNEFLTYWTEANPHVIGNKKPLAPDIDAHLHTERQPTSDGQRVLVEQPASDLPTGTFVVIEQIPYLVMKDERLLLPWSPAGYERAHAIALPDGPVAVLTPLSVVRAIAQGYRVEVHQSGKE